MSRIQDNDDGNKNARPDSDHYGGFGAMRRASILRGTSIDLEEPPDGPDVEWVLTHLDEIIASRQLTKTAPYRRQTPHRIFVNRGLQLDKIRYIGFDMDYTLAEYISPEYEALQFDLAVDRLITSMGYPAVIRTRYHYDHSFALRGLWFDKLHGNLLKVDQFGSILSAFHGFHELRPAKILELYPNRFVQSDTNRIYILNTLYDYAIVYLLASVVDYFDTCGLYEVERNGVKKGETFISYRSIFNDVRLVYDFIHGSGVLQQRTLEDIDKYLVKDERLPMMLQRLRQHSKVFVLTNSDYQYTNGVMAYLLEDPAKPDVKWTSFFDAIVVDAKKPLFFEEGTLLRQVDLSTGALAIGSHMGPLRAGNIYSGGSCDTFAELIGATGRDVLFVGDHIFSDIVKSKKTRDWRTYLVVPELHQELMVWTSKRDLFKRLQQLDILLADGYKNLDSSASILDTPHSKEIEIIKQAIRRVSREMELAYGGPIGSIFRSGDRQTFFANQVQRYADLYAVSALNLLHYPYSYFFKSTLVLLPHEAKVDPNSGYDPLAAFGDLPASQAEIVHNGVSKMRLIGRMSIRALSITSDTDNTDTESVSSNSYFLPSNFNKAGIKEEQEEDNAAAPNENPKNDDNK